MFIPHTYDDGQPMPFEKLPVTGDLAIGVGTALYVTGGKLALATGTQAPTYISRVVRDATTDGEYIEVERVADKVIYETELSVDSASIAIGTKYTIDATGGKITATTTSGVAEVVNFDGKTAGDLVRVRL